jgi:hypothetical protein
MSCWVVPTIAAEIWGVSVDHVLRQVRDGYLPHQIDEGFMFVDVFHNGGGGCGAVKQVEPPPPTFIVLSEAEVEALGKADEEPRVDPIDDSAVEEETESQSPDDDEASTDLGDWRAVRQRVGRSRIPPRARAQAA